jgi:hypothetical protein
MRKEVGTLVVDKYQMLWEDVTIAVVYRDCHVFSCYTIGPAKLFYSRRCHHRASSQTFCHCFWIRRSRVTRTRAVPVYLRQSPVASLQQLGYRRS